MSQVASECSEFDDCEVTKPDLVAVQPMWRMAAADAEQRRAARRGITLVFVEEEADMDPADEVWVPIPMLPECDINDAFDAMVQA